MAPIRIGFIGLSATMSWAVFAHIPYLKATSKYEIVALCNSSVSSAEAAIKAHGLPATTKAYGSPEDLAADPDVDLVVCSVRVDKHYPTLLPSIKAGKDVYCEWPLASNAKQAEEMLALAKEKGVKTVVGLQQHVSPTLKKIKEVIASGKIGKVLSSTFHGTPLFFGATVNENTLYQNDISSGGNLVTIYGVHCTSSPPPPHHNDTTD
jgi:predicted dehydrogenase